MGGGNFQNTLASLSYHLVIRPLVGNALTLRVYPTLKVHLKIDNFECNLILLKLMAFVLTTMNFVCQVKWGRDHDLQRLRLTS